MTTPIDFNEKNQVPNPNPSLSALIQQLKHRFAFHPATTTEKQDEHTSVRQQCLALGVFIAENVPVGREQSLALTALEEVMLWSNAGIARNQ